MALDNESFNKQLYDLLKVRGYKPVPKNSRNQNVEASQLADVMEFVFMKDGEEYGKAWASIDDASNVIIYYDDEQADSPGGNTPGVEYDDSWSGFLKHVKNWAQRKQLSFELANKDRLSDDMRQREYTKMKEKISEGYHSMGNKASYNDNVPNIKIILQHNRRIEEGEQRYRNVAKIFLENTEGERILAPTTRPGIAQIYARHLAEGGVPNDERWNHIKGLCEEYSKMAGFVRATRNNQFNESAQALVNEGINHYQSLRESLSKMRGHRGYNAYFESWTPPLMEDENDISISELFVQETVDPRIESVMPILSRLSKKSGIKPMTEVSELAEWAQSVLEGEDDGRDKFYYQRNDIWRVMDGDELVYEYKPERYEVVGAKKLLARFDDEGYDVTHVISPMGIVTYLYGKPEDELDESASRGIMVNGKEVDYASLEIDGVDSSDYPDFSDAYFSSGYFTDGTQMSDEDLDQLANTYGELVNRKAYDSLHEGGDGGEASEEEDVYTDADAGEEMDASAAEEMLEAPGAETLGHNQSTEKKNLAAFDLDEESDEGRPYICVHARKGRFECHANSTYEAAKKAAQKWGMKNTAGIDVHLADVSHSPASIGEALDPIAEKIAELEKQLKTATPQEAQKIKEILTLLKAKANRGSSKSSDGSGTAASRAEKQAKDRFSTKSSSSPSVSNPDNLRLMLGLAGLAEENTTESRMAEADSIIQDIINGDLDAYNVMANPKTPEEEYVANMMQEMYDDVSIEYSLHPDDDFEKILDIVVDQLAKDHKQDDNQMSMDLEEVDMGQADRTLRHTPRGDDDGKMSHISSLGKAAKKMGHDSYMDVPDDAVEKLKALAKRIRGGDDVSEDLDANQKRVGQLGPTEKVGPKGAVGKLVGASESIEVNEGQDDLDAIKRLLNRY